MRARFFSGDFLRFCISLYTIAAVYREKERVKGESPRFGARKNRGKIELEELGEQV